MVSWSQMKDTLTLLVIPDGSLDAGCYMFLTLMWQGIAQLHTDKVLHCILPMTTSYVRVLMLWYLGKRNKVLQCTSTLPPFLLLDQFLSYRLSLPSIKDWLKKLEITPLADTLPSFPWLDNFSPLIIDPEKVYSHIALKPPSDTPHSADTEAAVMGPLLGQQGPRPSAALVEHLKAMFQFAASSSPTASPCLCARMTHSVSTLLNQTSQHTQAGSMAIPRTLFQRCQSL